MIRLHLCGTPELERDGLPLALPAAKALALLGYLALAGTPQPRERIVGLLWAESGEEQARKNLRNSLWSLRRQLGEEAIVAEGERLRLSASIWVDARALLELAAQGPARSPAPQLEALAALYRGPILEGLVLAQAPEFEIWLTSERERFHQLFLGLAGDVLDAQIAAGRWAAVVTLARRLLLIDSLQEPVYRALMEAQARLGARAEALHAYDLLRSVLERELGVAPLPETEALRAAIQAGSLAMVPRAGAPPRQPLPVLGEAAPIPFVGRRAAQDALDTAWATLRRGQPRAVAISGPLGIGKTRLWAEWAATLPPEIPVLHSRCVETLGGLPLLPLVEVFGDPRYARPLYAPGGPLAPIWVAEIAQLLPELRAQRPDLPPGASLPPAEERRRIFEACVQCLRLLARPAVVLCVDDLHWADSATLDWLTYLLYRMRDTPLLLALTYRPEDAPPALASLLAQWARDSLLVRVALDPLAPAEAEQLLAFFGQEPTTRARVGAQAAGNPYFLIELARAGPGDLPSALADLVRARLGRMPETARQVLQALTVLGQERDLPLLQRVSGRTDDELIDALDLLQSGAVVTERGGRYGIAHPLIATVIRAELSGARRTYLHRRAAEALRTDSAGHLGPVAGELTAHYLAAGDRIQAADYADLAAIHARALAAPAEAVIFAQQALALAPTPARRVALAAAYDHAGELEQAHAAFAGLLDDLGSSPQIRAQAALGLADTLLSAGRAAGVVDTARAALALLGPGDEPGLLIRGRLLLGAGLLRAGSDLAAAAAELEAAAAGALAHGLTGLAARTQFELGNVRGQQGDFAAARAAMDVAIGLAGQSRAVFQEVLAQNNAAYYALLSGDMAAADEHLRAGLALAEEQALEVPQQWLYSTRGEIALARGEWALAEEWLRRGLAVAERYGNLGQQATYWASLALAAEGRSDRDEALALLAQAQALAAPLPDPFLRTRLDLWQAELHLRRGEQTAAARVFATAATRLAGQAPGYLHAWAARVACQL